MARSSPPFQKNLNYLTQYVPQESYTVTGATTGLVEVSNRSAGWNGKCCKTVHVPQLVERPWWNSESMMALDRVSASPIYTSKCVGCQLCIYIWRVAIDGLHAYTYAKC